MLNHISELSDNAVYSGMAFLESPLTGKYWSDAALVAEGYVKTPFKLLANSWKLNLQFLAHPLLTPPRRLSIALLAARSSPTCSSHSSTATWRDRAIFFFGNLVLGWGGGESAKVTFTLSESVNATANAIAPSSGLFSGGYTGRALTKPKSTR